MYVDTTDDYFEDASGGAASSGGRSLLADEAEESSSLSYDEDRIDPTGECGSDEINNVILSASIHYRSVSSL